MPRSLTRAGVRNSARVRAAATGLLAGDSSGALTDFHALAERSTFSANVSADKITAFDVHDAMLDARAIEQHRAGGDRRAGLRAFRRRQGKWYLGRVRFEALWRHGRQFVYGAVNAGGMGTEGRYGPFCVVIGDPRSSAPAALGVFPANSAERYCWGAGIVDSDRAQEEAVAWSDRAELATLQRARDVLATAPRDWPRVICAPDRFLEAVVAPAPRLSCVDGVRVRQTYLDRLEDLRLLGVDDGLQQATAQNEWAAFEALQRWRVAHGIEIEGVR